MTAPDRQVPLVPLTTHPTQRGVAGGQLRSRALENAGWEAGLNVAALHSGKAVSSKEGGGTADEKPR